MNTFLPQAVNIFFYVFHIGLILFNIFGWIWKRTRKWNSLTLGLTAFSWFGLGIIYGWGYCFLTDWHWEVRRKLGYSIESDSYIHFLVTSTTGINVSENLVNTLTLVLFFMAVVASVVLNVRDWVRERRVMSPQ